MKNRILKIQKNGAKDAEHFGFMDPDPQKYADPGVRIQGGYINLNW